jgi:hypothetical protein
MTSRFFFFFFETRVCCSAQASLKLLGSRAPPVWSPQYMGLLMWAPHPAFSLLDFKLEYLWGSSSPFPNTGFNKEEISWEMCKLIINFRCQVINKNK